MDGIDEWQEEEIVNMTGSSWGKGKGNGTSAGSRNGSPNNENSLDRRNDARKPQPYHLRGGSCSSNATKNRGRLERGDWWSRCAPAEFDLTEKWTLLPP